MSPGAGGSPRSWKKCVEAAHSHAGVSGVEDGPGEMEEASGSDGGHAGRGPGGTWRKRAHKVERGRTNPEPRGLNPQPDHVPAISQTNVEKKCELFR